MLRKTLRRYRVTVAVAAAFFALARIIHRCPLKNDLHVG
jgi:hypothetical protein